MRVDYAILARSIDINSDGTFSMLGGGIDTIRAQSVPVDVPSLAILVRISAFEEDQDREQTLTVEVARADQEKVMFGEFTLQPQPKPPSGWPASVSCVVVASGVRFQSAGKYNFTIRCGEEILTSLSLHVELKGGDQP